MRVRSTVEVRPTQPPPPPEAVSTTRKASKLAPAKPDGKTATEIEEKA